MADLRTLYANYADYANYAEQKSSGYVRICTAYSASGSFVRCSLPWSEQWSEPVARVAL